MRNSRRTFFLFSILSMILFGSGSAPAGALLGRSVLAGSTAEGGREFSYAAWARALELFVNPEGMVDYRALKASRGDLIRFTSELAALPAEVYGTWQEKERIAFWINVYNAFTLKLIVDHYPIRSSFFSSLVFPRNSIRQIDGAWDTIQFEVMGRSLTLDEIEHDILRREFEEPGIHMALVCAAKSCPPLRNEPFTGERLDEQLRDQTRRFLAHPLKFKIERSAADRGVVYLSPIFDWFGGDFTGRYGSGEFREQGEVRAAVLNFIVPHLPQHDRDFLERANYRIQYLDYDWSLNEQ